MRRGELWTASAGQGYAGKPRPVLIIQDDRFDATANCADQSSAGSLSESGTYSYVHVRRLYTCYGD